MHSSRHKHKGKKDNKTMFSTPIAPTTGSDFSSGICSCMENFDVCCCGIFCQGYLLCKANAFIEGRTEDQLTCCEKCGAVLLSVAAFWWVGALGAACWEACIRNKVRSKLNIQEKHECYDTLQTLCCYPCVLCQQEREFRMLQLQSRNQIAPSYAKPMY
jgi:Cys-rich protein (TIGR01571 family)